MSAKTQWLLYSMLISVVAPLVGFAKESSSPWTVLTNVNSNWETWSTHLTKRAPHQVTIVINGSVATVTIDSCPHVLSAEPGNILAIEIRGGNAGDTLNVLGNSNGMVRYYGGDGDDSLTNNATVLFAAYGGGGEDTLVGGPLSDLLVGEHGDDNIDGREGTDVLGGGAGDDVLLGGEHGDSILGGHGLDIIDGEGGDDDLWGHQPSNEYGVIVLFGTFLLAHYETPAFEIPDFVPDYIRGGPGIDRIKGLVSSAYHIGLGYTYWSGPDYSLDAIEGYTYLMYYHF